MYSSCFLVRYLVYTEQSSVQQGSSNSVQCQSVPVVSLRRKVAAEFLGVNSPCCRSVKTTRNSLFLRVEYDCFKIYISDCFPPSSWCLCKYQLQNSQSFWLHFQTLFFRLQSYLIIELKFQIYHRILLMTICFKCLLVWNHNVQLLMPLVQFLMPLFLGLCSPSPAHRAWSGPFLCFSYSWNPHEYLRSCALLTQGYFKAQKWNRWTVYLLLSYWQEASIQSLIGIMWWDEKAQYFTHA